MTLLNLSKRAEIDFLDVIANSLFLPAIYYKLSFQIFTLNTPFLSVNVL